eukprot:TRINITY_DN10365_c0_g1_i3.p1 TRINITY_DN10365_c0_g1~~TRINITY_DN10365_c0_g1_i3.p1  ORF type:complete len:563 (-),score=140.07 TRINITY_DN10365_c0_g1_i3:112-1800(-)
MCMRVICLYVVVHAAAWFGSLPDVAAKSVESVACAAEDELGASSLWLVQRASGRATVKPMLQPSSIAVAPETATAATATAAAATAPAAATATATTAAATATAAKKRAEDSLVVQNNNGQTNSQSITGRSNASSTKTSISEAIADMQQTDLQPATASLVEATAAATAATIAATTEETTRSSSSSIVDQNNKTEVATHSATTALAATTAAAVTAAAATTAATGTASYAETELLKAASTASSTLLSSLQSTISASLKALQLQASVKDSHNRLKSQQKSMDFGDFAILLYAILLLTISFALISVCVGTRRSAEEEPETLGERIRRAVANRWPTPLPGFKEEAFPAICGSITSQTKDVPILIPISGLEQRGKKQKQEQSDWWGASSDQHVAWSFDISGSSGNALFRAQQLRLSADGSLGPVQLLRSGSGDRIVASIDKALKLFDSDGQEFGQFVAKKSGAFELLESGTGRHRWLITPTNDEDNAVSFVVTWRPERKVIASVTRGHHSHKGFLKVMNAPGVDAVLVTMGVLGLMVYVLDPEEEPQEKTPSLQPGEGGFASSLLERLSG